ncbi:MAG: hypothetical protein ACOX02_01795 [Acholeplasmatales bacterium]
MKDFYEDAKIIKLISTISFLLVVFVLFSGLVALFIFRIMKIGTVDLDSFDVIISFFGLFLAIVFSIYIFVKADFTYFIEVKEGKLRFKIKGAEYVYSINEIEECYLEKGILYKKVIIKVSGSIIEITSRKPKKLLESIESWKTTLIN